MCCYNSVEFCCEMESVSDCLCLSLVVGAALAGKLLNEAQAPAPHTSGIV